jgi:tRNA(Phe) wybutosine-synthesizing methylase Tyw3
MFNRQNHLQKLHQQRKNATRDKADSAIMRLLKSDKAINFNSVAAESGLSKSTLYNNPDLRANIEKLKTQQAQLPTQSRIKREMSDQSKDAVIAALRRKIQCLTDDNQILKNQLNQNLAELYENI